MIERRERDGKTVFASFKTDLIGKISMLGFYFISFEISSFLQICHKNEYFF